MADDPRNPFTKLSSRDVYDNPWIKLVEHQVRLRSGRQSIYGVVSFKNRAIGIVPLEGETIWMVGQYRFPLSLYSWEIPEGGCPMDEEPLQAAQRELQEETGYTAERFIPLLNMHMSNSVTDELGLVYVATGLKPGLAQPEESEELEIKKLKLDEAYDQVEGGLITDSLTVTAIYKLMYLRERGQLPS